MISKHRWLIFIFIFLFSFVIRLIYLPDIEFKLDEAVAIYRANTFWTTGTLPSHGLIASFGGRNPPLFIYLLIPLVFLSAHPLFITFFFVVCGSLVPVLVYLYLHEKDYSLIPVLLSLSLAVSPWAVLFSRKIWAQNLLPLLSISLFLVLKHWRQSSKPRYAYLAIFLALVTWQLHLSALLLFPLVWFLIWPDRHRLSGKTILITGFLALLPLSPYLWLQLNQSFIDLRLLFGSSGSFDFSHLFIPFMLGSSFGFDRVLGADYSLFLNIPSIRIISQFLYLEALLILFCLIIVCNYPKARFLSIFFIITTLLSLVSRQPASQFYYEIFIPLIFLIVGEGLSRLKKYRPVTITISTLLVMLILAKTNFVMHFYHFVSDKQQITGDYGLVFQAKERLAQQATAGLRGHPDEKTVLTIARMKYSIYQYQTDKHYRPQTNLIPVVEYELKQKIEFNPVTFSQKVTD